jgi:hypothetical protein
VRRHLQVRRVADVPNLDYPEVPATGDDAPVHTVVHGLDAGDRLRREVAKHRRRRKWGVVGQAQAEPPIRCEHVGPSAPRTERTRTEAERRLHLAVELPNAPEARGERDLAEWQARLVEQSTGEACPPRAGDEVRGGADMGLEEPPQLAHAHEGAPRQLRLGVMIEKAICGQDEGDRNGDRNPSTARGGSRSGRQRRHGRNPAASAAMVEA